MQGIRLLQEDLSVEKPDLTPEIIQVLDRNATTYDNAIMKAEAERLLGRDEYLDLYKRIGIILPAALVLALFAKGGGYSNSIHYTHNSTLRTIEEIFNVTPLLGDASKETDLSDLFSQFL